MKNGLRPSTFLNAASVNSRMMLKSLIAHVASNRMPSTWKCSIQYVIDSITYLRAGKTFRFSS